jgi:hypothetical protein
MELAKIVKVFGKSRGKVGKIVQMFGGKSHGKGEKSF